MVEAACSQLEILQRTVRGYRLLMLSALRPPNQENKC